MPSGQLSNEAQNLLDAYKKALDTERNYNAGTEEEKITVHQVSGKIAFFYEKLRNTVDYKEEHLLRKNAVERILKRRIMTEKNEYDVSKFLVYELIRARYLPDKQIPEKRIEDVRLIIEKYTFLLNKIPDHTVIVGKKEESLFDWIIGIAAYEIEGVLVPHGEVDAMIDFARRTMEKKISVREELRISPDTQRELIYVAVLKNLIKSDLDMIRYKIFVTRHSDWLFAPSEDKFTRMAENMESIAVGIDAVINHEYGDNFSRAVKKNLAYFEILQDVASGHPKDIEHVFSHHYHIEDSIKETCVKKYRSAQTKLKRSATRSIAYIFITKVALALLIEVPFDKFFEGGIRYSTLLINILFPPLLMAAVVLAIKVPSKNNTSLIVTGVEGMLYDNDQTPSIQIKGNIPRNSLFSTVFKLLYLVVFTVSFGGIIYVLRILGFNAIGMFFFLFFISVVSYFGARIRKNARELLVVQQKEGITTFLIDLFIMPIEQVGQWLSVKMSNINVFVYVLDFIIEAPFKTFVEIFENWIYYVKEEKDKIE